MFAHAIGLVEKSMFPIFLFRTPAPAQLQIAAAGTGFFVRPDGYFITVAHVFDEAALNTEYKYWGRLPTEVHNPPVTIQEIGRDDANDLYLGRIAVKSPNYLRISKKETLVGRTICIAGYPLAALAINPQGGAELGGVRRYFQPSFVLDHLITNSANTSGKVRKHDGFTVRDFGLFGMSGGPVFDTSGTAVGVQGSVTDVRKSTNGTRTIEIQNAVAIRSTLVLDLLKKYNLLAS